MNFLLDNNYYTDDTDESSLDGLFIPEFMDDFEPPKTKSNKRAAPGKLIFCFPRISLNLVLSNCI